MVALGDATVETPGGRRGFRPRSADTTPEWGGVKVLPGTPAVETRLSSFKGLKTCETFIELMSMLKSANVE